MQSLSVSPSFSVCLLFHNTVYNSNDGSRQLCSICFDHFDNSLAIPVPPSGSTKAVKKFKIQIKIEEICFSLASRNSRLHILDEGLIS